MHVNELNLKVNLTYGDENIQDGGSSVLLMFIFWGVIMLVIGIIGVFGNIITCIILFRREMKSTTVYFLRTLVITDTGIIVGAILGLSVLSITQRSADVGAHWVFNDVIYPHIYAPTNYFVMALQTINVWTTVAVSLERFIAICFPFKSINICNKRNALITIAITAFFSTAYNIPRCFETGVMKCGNNCYSVITTEFGKSYFYTVVYSQWLYTILIYILPLLLLGILNTLLIMELMRMRKRRSLTNTQENTEFNLSIVLVIIVAVFILCQTPGLIAQFQFFEPDILMKWTCVSNTLFVLNSSVNFIIYVAVGKKFRTILLMMIRKCSGKQKVLNHSSSFWNTERELTTLTTVRDSDTPGENGDELLSLRENGR